MPPGRSAAPGGRHHLVRLGHVEQDTVEVAFVDPLGHVADLDPVRGIRAQSAAATLALARSAKSSRSS